MDVYKVFCKTRVKMCKIRTKREIHSKFLSNFYMVHLSFRLQDKIIIIIIIILVIIIIIIIIIIIALFNHGILSLQSGLLKSRAH